MLVRFFPETGKLRPLSARRVEYYRDVAAYPSSHGETFLPRNSSKPKNAVPGHVGGSTKGHAPRVDATPKQQHTHRHHHRHFEKARLGMIELGAKR